MWVGETGQMTAGAESPDARAVSSLEALHPTAIRDPERIRSLLEQVHRRRLPLTRGMNRRIDRETAWIERCEPGSLTLRTRDFEPGRRDAVFLNFEIDGLPYFFSAPYRDAERDALRLEWPSVVFRKERRSRPRRRPGPGDPSRVSLRFDSRTAMEGEIEDLSPEGLGVWVRRALAGAHEGAVELRYVDGDRSGRTAHGEIRNLREDSERPGWIRIGLGACEVAQGAPIRVEQLHEALPFAASDRVRRRLGVASAVARTAGDRALSALGRRSRLPSVTLVDYANDRGEHLRGIVDSWGDTRGATAVVIPPAWGRTKETLLPLAATIVEAFRAIREPIVVLRFDGVRKRGESHNEPGCDVPGHEQHRFTLSQGIRDVHTTLDFLERDPRFQPRRTLLVSFSAASIEARRAVAEETRIDGWICVVGAPDMQSAMRLVSGGVDYVQGVERGARFGIQDILGVQVDMDLAALDGLEHRLLYLEDARRDMARIRVPVTWIHGRHDCWMDAARVADMLRRGDTSKRRLVEVPTGHMLKTSKEAILTFQLVASEVARIALGRRIRPPLPDLAEVERRSRAERRRLKRAPIDLRSFWRQYLVGDDGQLGIELMTDITPYHELMERQIQGLQLRPGQVVADLGAGTGAFPLYLARASLAPEGLRVIEIDLVREGLERGRRRLGEMSASTRVHHVNANLDVRRGSLSIPLRSDSVDAVIGALFLSYLEDPTAALREIRRILKPGGRLVLSSLKRDADTSKLYTEGLEELRARGFDADDASLGVQARAYLQRASRLLDLEESGAFRFYDAGDLERIVCGAGFDAVTSAASLGHPAQATVVEALAPVDPSASDGE
jgi:ubiquinone/menaquinone biosynthesis C-methylase UbiE